MDPNGVTYPASLTCEMQNIQKVWHFLFSLFVTQCSTVRAHQGASVHKRSHQAWKVVKERLRAPLADVWKNKSLMKTVFTQSSTSVWIWLKVEGRSVLDTWGPHTSLGNDEFDVQRNTMWQTPRDWHLDKYKDFLGHV